MSWRIDYTRTFLKEMSRLPIQIGKRVEEIAFGEAIKQDPFLAGKTQKLTGYNAYYKNELVIIDWVYILTLKSK